MNAGDTAFILLCAAFVFIMTPGLAFFYGGMVRDVYKRQLLYNMFLFLMSKLFL